MDDTLLRDASSLLPDIIELRRELHRHPEIGNELPRTRETVLAALEGLPLDLHLHTTTSGIVAVLTGPHPGPTILLRGDMDALPMPEDTGLPYASEIHGSMHACGHDLHTAMLAGAARMLAARREQLSGTVVFMFQPGEEGAHGARLMMEEGLLDVVAVPPTGAFAIHVTALLEAGVISHRPGPQLASADEFHVTITGRGGHAAAPHLAADPVPVAAEIVLATQSALSRTVDARETAIVTVGKIDAGTTNNVIPETALLVGTMRTLSESVRVQVLELLERVSSNVAAAHGCTAELYVRTGYPVTINDPDFVTVVDRAVAALGGDAVVSPMEYPVMGAEDWSYVLQKVPGMMTFLGACPRELVAGEAPNNHSNRVRFEEDVMATGMALHASVALHHLNTATSD